MDDDKMEECSMVYDTIEINSSTYAVTMFDAEENRVYMTTIYAPTPEGVEKQIKDLLWVGRMVAGTPLYADKSIIKLV